ncbi:MAG: SDR family NAD(P)-dependent oxidoreductase, partial [Pseudomonadota bacterium]
MSPRIIAVTGAFGVLGEVVATAAVAQGARVALIDFNTVPPDRLLEACGIDALVQTGVDLADPDQAAKALDATGARFGRLDALINIAGG